MDRQTAWPHRISTGAWLWAALYGSAQRHRGSAPCRAPRPKRPSFPRHFPAPGFPHLCHYPQIKSKASLAYFRVISVEGWVSPAPHPRVPRSHLGCFPFCRHTEMSSASDGCGTLGYILEGCDAAASHRGLHQRSFKQPGIPPAAKSWDHTWCSFTSHHAKPRAACLTWDALAELLISARTATLPTSLAMPGLETPPPHHLQKANANVFADKCFGTRCWQQVLLPQTQGTSASHGRPSIWGYPTCSLRSSLAPLCAPIILALGVLSLLKQPVFKSI